jgi:phospholipase/carboxylesterase
MSSGPHADGRLLQAGVTPHVARAGLVLVHGRGGSAEDILGLHAALKLDDIAVAAPEAAGNSWWPVSFLAPMEQLAPWLDSALAAVDRAVMALEAGGLPRDRIVLCGFSQGACLALEHAARRGGPLAAVAALSGGLVGTADAPGGAEAVLYGYRPKTFGYRMRLDGVPAYLACHRADPHIPLARVEQTATVLREMGALVDASIHPGAGHGITAADLAAVRRLLAG